MIGRATASLAVPPRRWVLRLWGVPSIHTRQKWLAVWPHLAGLGTTGVRLLDAGCGDGSWSLELAARRPRWEVVGIDRDPVAIASAEAGLQRLGLPNVVFRRSDFLASEPELPFDVILSVASAHYLMAEGRGEELFRQFGAGLRPGGLLVMLAPRHRGEVPCLPLLPPPFRLRDVVSGDGLRGLCRTAGFEACAVIPVVGPLGTWAKQLAMAVGRSRLLAGLTYPLLLLLSALDRLTPRSAARRSAGWVLVARRTGLTAPAAPLDEVRA